jgi:hypothetical protein
MIQMTPAEFEKTSPEALEAVRAFLKKGDELERQRIDLLYSVCASAETFEEKIAKLEQSS